MTADPSQSQLSDRLVRARRWRPGRRLGALARMKLSAPILPSADAEQSPTQSISDAADPRWVLAMRSAESLEGTILRPEKRQKLIRLGRMMGLSLFDSNLVIAIVQDQARRGYAPSYCPGAGEKQLAMVPLPRQRRSPRQTFNIISAVVATVGMEVLLLWWLLLG